MWQSLSHSMPILAPKRGKTDAYNLLCNSNEVEKEVDEKDEEVETEHQVNTFAKAVNTLTELQQFVAHLNSPALIQVFSDAEENVSSIALEKIAQSKIT